MSSAAAEQPAKPVVLVELRPALEGFAGIPQETRLLFRGLATLDSLALQGLLATPYRRLARGTSASRFPWVKPSIAAKINRYSRVVISVTDQPHRQIWRRFFSSVARRTESFLLSVSTLFGVYSIRLTTFDPRYFEDFVWQTLFGKTLPADDFPLVTQRHFKVCATSWDTQQRIGLFSLNFRSTPRYALINTRGVDVLITQTPYPARVSRGTVLIVRYHDAIPVFMPHVIDEKAMHQAKHFYSLMSNVGSGAYFACVSESSRAALLSMFPEAAARAIAIPNMVSHHYFPEASPAERVAQIIRSRLNRISEVTRPSFLTLREETSFYKQALAAQPLRYLLMVSTIEPRKNHLRLLAAWEAIRAELDPNLKLVIVGDLGWQTEQILLGFRAGIIQGNVFFLNRVPAPDLRVLYRHALATVCPSLGEGFDYSGIEAMRSGGIAIASDIAVHQEVYADAAEYFDPYSTTGCVNALKNVLYSEDTTLREHLRARGPEVSSRYLPEKIIPQWEAFIQRTLQERQRP